MSSAETTGRETVAGAFSQAVLDYLASYREMTMFCRDADGLPIGYPMFVFSHSPETILFSTYRKSAKVEHLERDPRVALLSIQPHDSNRVRWLHMEGRARIWAPNADEIDALFDDRRGDPRVPDTMGALVRQRTIEGKRVLLKVAVTAPEQCRVLEARR
jgi:general stress protein 26